MKNDSTVFGGGGSKDGGKTSRRHFGAALLSGMAAESHLLANTSSAAVQADTPDPDIAIGAQLWSTMGENDLRLVRQLGLTHISTWTRSGFGDNQAPTLENFIRLRTLVEDAGLKLWNINNMDVHNMDEVTLNLPGRDEKINQYIQYLRNIAACGGIPYTTYAHMGNGIWRTAREETRGTPTQAFDMAHAETGQWHTKTFSLPLSHGRVYSQEEIWDNYAYFIRRVAPVAEETGIRIGIHPDDPPVPEIGGVPRCIFSSFDGYRRAMEMADSPNVGLCLCVGCWLEGDSLMGRDILETIEYFGRKNKLFKVHFRNVDRPLPHFKETFMDNGYADMYPIMKALWSVGFKGVIVADHVPSMQGGSGVGMAYSVAYMRALIERASNEAAQEG